MLSCSSSFTGGDAEGYCCWPINSPLYPSSLLTRTAKNCQHRFVQNAKAQPEEGDPQQFNNGLNGGTYFWVGSTDTASYLPNFSWWRTTGIPLTEWLVGLHTQKGELAKFPFPKRREMVSREQLRNKFLLLTTYDYFCRKFFRVERDPSVYKILFSLQIVLCYHRKCSLWYLCYCSRSKGGCRMTLKKEICEQLNIYHEYMSFVWWTDRIKYLSWVYVICVANLSYYLRPNE
jgi:hypothetical protein